MSYQVGRTLAIVRRVAAEGRPVDFDSGWDTRGSSVFGPLGHVLHHDAIHRDALALIRAGHAALSGPLANFYVVRNGTLWVVAAGRANHAGRGGWEHLTGNGSVWGTEVANNGLGEPYTSAQVATIDVLERALAADVAVALMCSHAEWAPGRKTDIGSSGVPWNMTVRRSRLRSNPGGFLMALSESEQREILDFARLFTKGAPSHGVPPVHVAVARVDRNVQQLGRQTGTGITDAGEVALEKHERRIGPAIVHNLVDSVLPEIRQNVRNTAAKVGVDGVTGEAKPAQTPLAVGGVDTEELAHAVVQGLSLRLGEATAKAVVAEMLRLAAQMSEHPAGS